MSTLAGTTPRWGWEPEASWVWQQSNHWSITCFFQECMLTRGYPLHWTQNGVQVIHTTTLIAPLQSMTSNEKIRDFLFALYFIEHRWRLPSNSQEPCFVMIVDKQGLTWFESLYGLVAEFPNSDVAPKIDWLQCHQQMSSNHYRLTDCLKQINSSFVSSKPQSTQPLKPWVHCPLILKWHVLQIN